MSGYNRVILIGNLTRDPEVRYTPQGVAVCDLRLAVTTKRGSSRDGGERRDETLFIDATVWERNAENAQQYLAKGRPVLVEGRLIEDSWDDKSTGEKRSKVKITVDRMQFLPRNDGAGGGGGDAPASSGSGRQSYGGGQGGGQGSGRGFQRDRGPAQNQGGGRAATPDRQPSGGGDYDDDFAGAAAGPAPDDIPF